MMNHWDVLWTNTTLATMVGEKPYGLITNAAMAIKDGVIVWLGLMEDLPTATAQKTYNANGRCITPGLIDCHTHLVYAGNRASEFELRLQGRTYEEIARLGGGILSTVKATREASEESLFQQSLKRASAMLAAGVTTLEIKSGYGLDLATELKMLRVIKRLRETLGITLFATFLGAHTVPPEFHGRADAYVDWICQEMIPLIVQEKLADAVDVFCETIAFSYEQTKKIFQCAKEFGLRIKCHAEQLSNSKGAMLAAEYQALSVDHLEFLSHSGVQAIKKSGTVAVLLPSAFYFLREKQLPPIELLRQHRVPIAIATDCNPGTSPTTSLPLVMNMASVLFRLTPEEVWLGVTRHAAQALGLAKERGSLAVGMAADFVVWDVEHPAEVVYAIGTESAREVFFKIPSLTNVGEGGARQARGR